MAGITIYQPEEGAVVDANRQYGRVLYRRAWADAWETLPYVMPLESERRVAPGISEAKLHYKYGNIKREDKSAFEVYEIQELAGGYVRIDEVGDTGEFARWHGIVDDDSLDVHGALDYPQGDQDFGAHGLEQLLERLPLRTAKVWQASATVEIQRLPAFNHMPTGTGLQGNRSTAVHTDDVYEFSDDGAVWNAKQVAESLLAWHLPAAWPGFTLAGQVELLERIERVWSFVEGTTLREALNRLIDRRRGLGWMIRVGDNDEVMIWVYSILDEPVSVGDQVVDANAEIVSYTLDDAIDIDKVMVVQRAGSKYGRVIVQGRRAVSIFTASFVDGTLAWGAPSSLLTSYKAGAASATGYGSLGSNEEKAAWNDEVRSEDRFDRLGIFRIPANWDRRSGDGEGGSKAVAMPTLEDDGTLDADTAAALWAFGKKLLPMLPGFYAGMDYSANPPTDNNPAGAEPELRRPLILIKDGDRYRYLDKQSIRSDAKDDIPNATVRMLDGELGFQVDMRPRHWLLKNHWSGAEPSFLARGFAFDSDQALDYEDIVATLALEGDQRVRVVAGGGDNEETLVITLDEAQLVYLAPNTVVGIDADGALQHSPAEGVLLVDNRDLIEAVASLAWAWYSKVRAQVTISGEFLHPIVPVGALLKSVQSANSTRDVGTVVTSERIDWSGRKVTIRTSYAGMGFADLASEIPTKRQLVGELQTVKAELQQSGEKAGRGGVTARIGVPSIILAATAGLLLPQYVTTLDADNPDTVTAGARFRSTALNTYGHKKKAVFKFRRPQPKDTLIRAALGWLQLEMILRYTTGTGTFSREITLGFLAKEIPSDFDISLSTWNSPGYTVGANHYLSTSILHVNPFNAAFVNSIDFDDIAGDSTKLKSMWMVTSNSGNGIAVQSDLLYGLELSGLINATQPGDVSSSVIDGLLTPLLDA